MVPMSIFRRGPHGDSVSDIIKRWIGIVDDLGACAWLVATSRSDYLPCLLLLSSCSMLANRFLLDFELAEKHVALVFLNPHLFLHVIVIIVEFAHSPIRSVVIALLMLWATSKLLVEIWVLHLVTAMHFLVLSRRNQTCTKSVRLRLNLHLSLGCLLLGKFFVHVLVDFLWTGVGGGGSLSHLLAHHLRKSTVSAKLQDSFRLLILITLLALLFSQLVDVRLGQCTCFMRLPLDVVELLEGFLLHKNL